MSEYSAIPPGFLTVGQLARKMNTTVRTIQYYDQVGLLKPAAVSEGGRRLYTDREVIRLHEIQSLQHLGFSLEEIASQLSSLTTPEEVVAALDRQHRQVLEQIAKLTQVAQQIGMLRDEVKSMGSVDYSKYADIVLNLQYQNPYFWMIKYFDDETVDYLRNRFDEASAEQFISKLTKLIERARKLMSIGATKQDPSILEFAQDYWNLISEFTNGDQKLIELLQSTWDSMKDEAGNAPMDSALHDFIEGALESLFASGKENAHEGCNMHQESS